MTRTKIERLLLVLTVATALVTAALMLEGCTINKQITNRDIASWANSIYVAQYDDYLSWFDKAPDGKLIIKPNTPEPQRRLLVKKKAIFVKLQPLLLIYSEYVKTGVVPTGVLISDVEAQMVRYVNELIAHDELLTQEGGK